MFICLSMDSISRAQLLQQVDAHANDLPQLRKLLQQSQAADICVSLVIMHRIVQLLQVNGENEECDAIIASMIKVLTWAGAAPGLSTDSSRILQRHLQYLQGYRSQAPRTAQINTKPSPLNTLQPVSGMALRDTQPEVVLQAPQTPPSPSSDAGAHSRSYSLDLLRSYATKPECAAPPDWMAVYRVIDAEKPLPAPNAGSKVVSRKRKRDIRRQISRQKKKSG